MRRREIGQTLGSRPLAGFPAFAWLPPLGCTGDRRPGHGFAGCAGPGIRPHLQCMIRPAFVSQYASVIDRQSHGQMTDTPPKRCAVPARQRGPSGRCENRTRARDAKTGGGAPPQPPHRRAGPDPRFSGSLKRRNARVTGSAGTPISCPRMKREVSFMPTRCPAWRAASHGHQAEPQSARKNVRFHHRLATSSNVAHSLAMSRNV